MKARYFILGTAGLVLAVAWYSHLKHIPATAAPASAPDVTPPVRSAPVRTVTRTTAPEAIPLPTGDAAMPAVDPFAELKRRLDDPQQRAANLARARLNIEQTYGRLFQRLRHYPPDVLERLKTALAEKQLAIERGMLPDLSQSGDAGAAEAKERLDRIQQEADEQIRGLFGDEIHAQYRYVQQSEPLQRSVEQVTNVMRSRGIDVSAEMQERILAGYTSALSTAAGVAAKDTTPEAFHALSDAARQELRAKQQARTDEILASTMSKILGPDEYRVFMESEFAQRAGSP